MIDVLDFFLMTYPSQTIYFLMKFNFVFCMLENLQSAKVKDFLINLFNPNCIKYSFKSDVLLILSEYALKFSLPIFLTKACYKYESIATNNLFQKGFIDPTIEKMCKEMLFEIESTGTTHKNRIEGANASKYRHIYISFYLSDKFYDSRFHEMVWGFKSPEFALQANSKKNEGKY